MPGLRVDPVRTASRLRGIAAALDAAAPPSLSAACADIRRAIASIDGRAPYVIKYVWKGPEADVYLTTADLTPDEFKQMRSLICWLRRRSGDQWGRSMVKITAIPVLEGFPVESELHHQDFDALLSDVVRQTRYFETGSPGAFYGERHPLLDSHPS